MKLEVKPTSGNDEASPPQPRHFTRNAIRFQNSALTFMCRRTLNSTSKIRVVRLAYIIRGIDIRNRSRGIWSLKTGGINSSQLGCHHKDNVRNQRCRLSRD